MHQHDTDTIHGRCPGGQLRTSRNGNGHGPVVYSLWNRFLRFDPEDPIWPDRDRFVLSIGHASMLIYSMLHLSGIKAVNAQYERLGELSVNWRTSSGFASSTANAPAIRSTVGLQASRRPRGPWDREWQPASGCPSPGVDGRYFNRPDFEMFNYNVYALCGDGCMMEGIRGGRFAGRSPQALQSLIYETTRSRSGKHRGLSAKTWLHVYRLRLERHARGDANDLEMLERALKPLRIQPTGPPLIIVDSHIAYGSPNKQDTHAAHGDHAGRKRKSADQAELRLAGRDAKFIVPEEVRGTFRSKRGYSAPRGWMKTFNDYQSK